MGDASVLSEVVEYEYKTLLHPRTESIHAFPAAAPLFLNQSRSGWKASQETVLFELVPTYVNTSKCCFGLVIDGVGRFFVESALKPEGGS